MKRQEFLARLFDLQDPAYREFHSRLMPTVPREKVIGIRIPQLRKFAREFAKTPDAAQFLAQLPHEYYEENNLHMFLLQQETDFDRCVTELTRFLPFVDNWATCDIPCPKVFADYIRELRPILRRWMADDHPYTVRYAIGVLLQLCLDEAFSPEDLRHVAEVTSEEYYVNMMRAWYFATALAKQYDAALPWLEECRLDPWTHNKTIQKTIESYRISPEQKEYLRTLRRK